MLDALSVLFPCPAPAGSKGAGRARPVQTTETGVLPPQCSLMPERLRVGHCWHWPRFCTTVQVINAGFLPPKRKAIRIDKTGFRSDWRISNLNIQAPVMPDPKLERLRSYPKEARYSFFDLRRVVANVPWHRDVAVQKAAPRLSSFMNRALSSWRSLAGSLGRAPETTVRNLIAAAREEDLPTYRLVLRWASANRIESFDSGFEAIAELLPPGTAFHRLSDEVLLSRKMPSRAQLVDVLRSEPKRMVRTILGGDRCPPGNLGDLFASAVELCGSESPSRVSAAVSALLEIVHRHHLPPSLTGANLAALPEVWRRAILFSSARRAAFVQEELLLSLESDPLQHADMPQSIRRDRATDLAIAAIGGRYFGNKAIAELLADGASFQKSRDRVQQALSRSAGQARSRPPGGRFATAGSLVHDETALALLLRVTGGAVMRLQESRGCQHRLEGALRVLPDGAIASVLGECDSEVRQWILDALDGGRRTVIRRKYEESSGIKA